MERPANNGGAFLLQQPCIMLFSIRCLHGFIEWVRINAMVFINIRWMRWMRLIRWAAPIAMIFRPYRAGKINGTAGKINGTEIRGGFELGELFQNAGNPVQTITPNNIFDSFSQFNSAFANS